jgi:hypothetical protein
VPAHRGRIKYSRLDERRSTHTEELALEATRQKKGRLNAEEKGSAAMYSTSTSPALLGHPKVDFIIINVFSFFNRLSPQR